jgi:hypothetical protein
MRRRRHAAERIRKSASDKSVKLAAGTSRQSGMQSGQANGPSRVGKTASSSLDPHRVAVTRPPAVAKGPNAIRALIGEWVICRLSKFVANLFPPRSNEAAAALKRKSGIASTQDGRHQCLECCTVRRAGRTRRQ